MRKQLGISVLALGAALAVTPAGAVDLLGTAGVTVGTTPSENPTVAVDTGLGVGATVDTNDGVDVNVDTTTNTDTGVNVDTGNLGLGGNNDIIDLDTNDGDGVGVDLNGTGDPDDVTLDLDGNGGNDAIVDLFGDTDTAPVVGVNRPAPVAVETGDDAIVDLFGDDAAPTAEARLPVVGNALARTDVGTGDVDLDAVLGGDIIPDLFGQGGTTDLLPDDLVGGLDIGVGSLGPKGNDPGAPGMPGAPGAPGQPGAPGSIDDDDTSPGTIGIAEATDDDGGSTTVMAPNARTTTTVNAITTVKARPKATANAKGKCFTPTDDQIAHLMQSHEYSDSTVASWQNIGQIKLVPVQLCPEARVKVSEVSYDDVNMSKMRAAIEQTPSIGNKLGSVGRSANDVLAVAKKDGAINVYVY